MSVIDEPGGNYVDITSYIRAPNFTDGARAAISFTGNNFTDTGRIGIVTHDFVHSTITGNTFSKTVDDFGYGVEIGSRSTASITNNSFSGFDTAAASDGSAAAGLYIENAFTSGLGPLTKSVTVTGNEISDCQIGAWIGNNYNGFAGDVDIDVTFSGNDLHDNFDHGLFLVDEDASSGSSVRIACNGNNFDDNGTYGIWAYTNGDGDLTLDLEGETLTGNGDSGLRVDDGSPAGSSTYSVAINLSDISGNTSHGIENGSALTTVDALCNWWGSGEGPSGPGNNPATGDVDASSWLLANDFGVDTDGDGVTSCTSDNGGDCNLAGGDLWGPPTAITTLSFSRDTSRDFSWSAPTDIGATIGLYDLLRSVDASDFSSAVCLESGDTDLVATDSTGSDPSKEYFYLIRVRNGCGAGYENLGADSAGSPRTAPACP